MMVLISVIFSISVLCFVLLTLDIHTLRAKYNYVATASEQQLSQALERVIGEIDPLLVEALS